MTSKSSPLVFFAFVAVAAMVVAVWPSAELDRKYTRAGRRTSGALEALDFWAMQRAYPERVIPDVGHALAFEYSRATLRGGSLDGETPPWDAIGPTNIGGRTLAVAFNPQNPNTIWAGSASGGVWRSLTGGVGPDAWDRILTGFPVLGVSSIVFAPDDSSTVYIGTGEVPGYQNAMPGIAVRTTRGSYGIGILRSTDGGTTWEKSLDWSLAQRRGVAGLAMHPADGDIVYAATTEGVYKTTNGGANWEQVLAELMAMHVVVDPGTPERVYAATGNFGFEEPGIWRTENGGASWAKLTSGLPATWSGKVWLDIYEASPNVVYASIANSFNGLGIYRSLDSGDSWQRVSTTDYAQYQGWYSHWVGVDPADSSKVLAGGIDIWRSTSGGSNLVRKSFWYEWFFGNVPPGGPEGPPDYAHADHHAIAYHPSDPDIVYFGTDGGVFRSLDGGQTFEGVNGGYQTSQFYNGFSSAISDPTIGIGGMQDNATAIYEGDVGWRRVIGGDGSWTAIHPLNTSIMYGSYQNLSILRSFDLGVNWNDATSGIGGETAAFVAPFVISNVLPDVLYAGTTKAYKSTNGASSWFPTNSNVALDGNNPIVAMGISWLEANTVYAATAPIASRMHVFVTTDGGADWNDITGSLPDRFPTDVCVAPGDPAVAYLALGGFGASHLWKTTDFGTTWVDVGASLPDVPASAVTIDPDNAAIVYFGNDLGVYASTNGGVSWNEFQDGMPPAMVLDLSVSWQQRKLRAATHGNGVYEREMLSATTAIAAGDSASGTPVASRVAQLLPNTPNPFNPTTELHFVLSERRDVSITVHDASGRLVAKVAGGTFPAGVHHVRFEAGELASGVYMVQLAAGDVVESRKIVLAR